MKKTICLLLIALLGITTASAQALLATNESSTNIFETPEFVEIIDASFPTEVIQYLAELTDEERAEQIDIFLAQNRKYLPKKKIGAIRETLMGLNETRLRSVLMSADDEFKNPTMVFVISLFFGGLGVDRFMIGEAGWGILKLITVGGFGVWYLVDLFIIQNKTRNYNYKELMELCGKYY